MNPERRQLRVGGTVLVSDTDPHLDRYGPILTALAHPAGVVQRILEMNIIINNKPGCYQNKLTFRPKANNNFCAIDPSKLYVVR